MRVFVTGATGLIGSRLVRALEARGDAVVALSRKPPANSDIEYVAGDPSQPGDWLAAMRACDAVVHLAGAGLLDHRWTAAYKQTIRDSRVNSTRLIAESLAAGGPRVLISGSAVGYYGADRGDEALTESSPAGTDFLAGVCADWEAAAEPARMAGVRVAHPRTGIVLDAAGGALPPMARPYKLFAGGRVGSGRQFVSWIHHADMTGLLLFALDAELRGPFNAVAPTPVTNDEFGRELGRALHRPHWLPVPSAAVRLLFGESAAVVLGSLRATPAAALAAGFAFRFPARGPALADVFPA